MNKLKAVIFDLDGLLINSEQMYIDCWKTIIQNEGIDLDIQIIIGSIGSSGKVASEYVKGKLNKDFPIDELRQRKDKLFNDRVKENGMPLKKGAMEIFKYLDEKGIKKVLVTSTFEERARFLLKHANINGCFDFEAFGSNELKSKPHPDLYNKMKLLTGTKREECVVLEDSVNGINAANNADLDVIGVPDIASINYLHLPHLLTIKNDLLEVIAYIEEKYFAQDTYRNSFKKVGGISF